MQNINNKALKHSEGLAVAPRAAPTTPWDRIKGVKGIGMNWHIEMLRGEALNSKQRCLQLLLEEGA